MKKIIAQDWLGEITSEVKKQVKSIGRNPAGETEKFWELKTDELLEGELKIDGFPELKLIDFRWEAGNSIDKGLLTKVTITNCPKLENINLTNNKINELSVSGLGSLNYLLASHNELGKINVRDCENLQWIVAFSKEKFKEEWEGLEDLGKLILVNSDYPFIPVGDLKSLKIITDPVKGLNILKADGTIDEEKLKEYKEGKNRPSQEQLDNLQTQLTSTQTKLNITNLNDLVQLPAGETPTTLLQRPTREDYDRLKTERDNRPNITVDNYNQLVLSKNTLQGQLTRAQADLAKVQADLAKWNNKFPNQTPEQVEAEINRLKQSAVTLTPDQQRKINDYDRLKTEKETLERRREAVLKELIKFLTNERYQQFIAANNKIN